LAQSVEGPQAFDETSAYLTWLAGSETRWACGYEPDSPEGARRWLGMAHGIAGVLATLAISHASIAAPLRATMVGAARNLIGHARWDRGVASWPRAVEDVPDEPCRSVWCVGAAGIAIALLQVAQTVDDAYAEAIARDVLSTIARLPIVALKIDGQGFCHGTAGLSSIFFVAARRTGDLEYARACERFVIETLGALDRTEGRCFALGFDGVRYDALGAYNGISGIVLALLTAGGGFDERWMRLHALAP
jgi:lantibiotic modifying enzyme